jgi:hypothetical protein
MKFVKLEVKGVRHVGDEDVEVVEDDVDAEFYSIYGRDECGFAYCVGDFTSRNAAETIKAALENG